MDVLYEGESALERSSQHQREAYRRLRGRRSVHGVSLLADGTLRVGYHSCLGREREAIISANGHRLEARGEVLV